MSSNSIDPLAQSESSVRGYARLFPTNFRTAKGSILTDVDGTNYIDFFCGAGSLNYGHNNPRAKAALLEYIERDGIQHSLDTITEAKVDFVDTFRDVILRPRGMDYKLQFTGPTGTNAVEAAVKLARKHTGRSHVVAFTHAYHGHSLGSLALTANQDYHSEFYGSHNNVTHLPFDGYLGDGFDTSDLLSMMLSDPASGLPKPAAVILETIQGEGGINVARTEWLQKVAEVCRRQDVMLIVDDIQVGNGRTGTFFSFEESGIEPDLICLSKSLGGGLPFSLVLIRPQCDVWNPGEHTGTFRGNNLAFVAATAVLSHWRESEFVATLAERSRQLESGLRSIASQYAGSGVSLRGRGMIWGLDVGRTEIAKSIIRECFQRGLLLESSGAHDEVLKAMPALNIPEDLLHRGLETLAEAVELAVHTSATGNATPGTATAENGPLASPRVGVPMSKTVLPLAIPAPATPQS
jgi:diaminobutyrate-2-oxoglutarate transaminase